MGIKGDVMKRTGFNGHRKLGSIDSGAYDDQTQNIFQGV